MKKIYSYAVVFVLILCMFGNCVNAKSINTAHTNDINPIWKKMMSKYPLTHSQIKVNNSYLYITGYDVIGGIPSACLLKCDLEGNELWNTTWEGYARSIAFSQYGPCVADDSRINVYGGPTPIDVKNTSIYSITTINSYIYLCGQTTRVGQEQDIVIAKYDLTTGNEIWRRTWGGNLTEIAYTMTTDGSFLYITAESSNYTVPCDNILLKYDLNGNQIWNVSSVNYYDFYGRSIGVDNSNIYAVYSNLYCGLLRKYDKDGNMLLNLSFINPIYDFESLVIRDNWIYIVGSAVVKSAGGWIQNDALLLKCDMNGNEIWNKTWGNETYGDVAYSIACDEGFLYISGKITGEGPFIIKTDLDGGGGASEYPLLVISVGIMTAVFIIIMRKKR